MRTMKHIPWLTIAVCLTGAAALAKDIPGGKDHPLLKRFEGSEIVRYKTENYDTLDFYDKDKTKVTQEGQMVRVLFRIPAGKTTALEVFRNYENELKEKGWKLVLSGPSTFDFYITDLVGQHKFDAKFVWEQIRNPYYIYAVKHDPAGDVHLDVIVSEIGQDGETFKTDDVAVSVDSIQVKAVANKMVDGTADELANKIATEGRVNLYGIYFDFDKTDIKPESKPTLDEVGKLLNNDATLKLEVVGHTDNQGTADYNNNLSMRRAQAVVTELITAYHVAPDRLQASGKGFSEPVAPNDTDAGRAKNRRVELVKG